MVVLDVPVLQTRLAEPGIMNKLVLLTWLTCSNVELYILTLVINIVSYHSNICFSCICQLEQTRLGVAGIVNKLA